LYSFPPLEYLFHPTYLPSVFAQYFSSVLSLPLSHFVAPAPHVLDRLTLLSAHPTPSLLLFRPILVLSLFVPASRVERAALSHSLCRLKPFTLFLSHLYLVLCSHVYLLNLPHQPFAYSSLSLIHSNIYSLSTLSNAALRSRNSTHILPFFLFSSLCARWSRMYTLSTVLLPFLNPAWLSGTTPFCSISVFILSPKTDAYNLYPVFRRVIPL
jgi:hypothetical protein